MRASPGYKPQVVECVMPALLVAENLQTGLWEPNFPNKGRARLAKAVTVEFSGVFSDRFQSLVQTVFKASQALKAQAYQGAFLISTRLQPLEGKLSIAERIAILAHRPQVKRK